jgi:hypothetical protein
MVSKRKREELLKKATSEPQKRDDPKHEFETMSQKQNRYGHGREHNGSDGDDQIRRLKH